MQPLCLLLPVGTDMAVRLWSVLELGMEARACDTGASPKMVGSRLPSSGISARRSPRPDHISVLASVFRSHLFGDHPNPGGLWLERRELADVLRLIEAGILALDRTRQFSEGSTALTLESVSAFLAGIRAQMGVVRKPAQRHSPVGLTGMLAAGA